MVGFIVLKKESTYICATYRKCMNAMKNYTYHLVAVLTVGIWGLTFISTKVLIGHGLSPQEIFLLRFLIAYMGIWLISPRKLFADNWKDEFWMFLGGMTGGSFYFFTENTALEITLATNVSFIVCTAPLLTTILSLWIYKKEKATRGLMAGSLLALVGVALVVYNGSFAKEKGKGHYVGTIHQAQGLRPGMTLFFEGDDSTYVDNKMRLHGTGSEDYYNGGWYALLDRWDRGNSLPLHGCLDYSLPMARTGGYRFFLADKMSYEKEIYHGMEHGEVKNNFPVDYTSVGFFYAAQPLQGREEPTAELRTVYQPTEHIYFPQLMQLSLGGGVQVTNERGIRMTTQHGGVVRIMLNDVPEGKYKVLINYFEKPNGADFQVWQRQKQLSGWISTKKDKEVSKDRVHVGDINLTEQTNSVTFHVRNNNGGDQFELGLIILERIKE